MKAPSLLFPKITKKPLFLSLIFILHFPASPS